MKKLFAIGLIIIGSFLEIWFYVIRFQRDGFDFWIAAVMGGFLALLLSILVILKNGKKWIWFGIIPLIVYSVLATASGQSFHLSQLEKTEIVDIAKNENLYTLIEDSKKLKNQYEKERQQISSRINAVSVWSRKNLYTEEIDKLEKRRDWLDTKIIMLQEKIDSDSRNIEITDQIKKEKIENSYEFYEKLSGVPARWSQFILQVLLSIFFAIGAPIGITLLLDVGTKKTKVLKKKISEKPKIVILPDKIARWVQISWSGVRQGKTDKIIPEHVFMKFMKNRKEDFSKKEYDIIKKSAQECNIIDKDKIIIYNEIEASRRIAEKLK